MSFNASVEVDGTTFRVLNYHADASRSIDGTNRPSSLCRAGVAKFTIELSPETNLFSEWAFDSYLMKKVVFKYEKRDTKATLRTVTYEDSYLIKYSENFEATGSVPATITFTISAREVDSDGARFGNDWV